MFLLPTSQQPDQVYHVYRDKASKFAWSASTGILRASVWLFWCMTLMTATVNNRLCLHSFQSGKKATRLLLSYSHESTKSASKDRKKNDVYKNILTSTVIQFFQLIVHIQFPARSWHAIMAAVSSLCTMVDHIKGTFPKTSSHQTLQR